MEDFFLKPSDIIIDKTSDQPIYQQIVEQISHLVEKGVLNPGDKLPTGQEFFDTYGIARGTVKHAYSLLEKDGTITVIQGKGSFINEDDNSIQNTDVIDTYLDQLIKLDLSLDDIEILVSEKFKKLGEQKNVLQIAIIESCPEMLDCISESLTHFRNLNIVSIFVNDISSIFSLSLESYDFIIITETNAQILLNMDLNHSIKKKILPISLAFSMYTLKLLAKIIPGEAIGIYCQTKRYAGIIKWELSSLSALLTPKEFLLFSNSYSLEDFCKTKNHILISNNYKEYCTEEQLSQLKKFEDNGGSLIPIEYTIDKGSSLYLEECIHNYQLSNL